MAANSKIEWTDDTFNPWTGCTKISTGCDHCYAEGWSKRAGAKVGKWGPGAPRVRTTPANWRKPLQWNAEPFYECPACHWRGEGKRLHGICRSACPECFSTVNNARRRVFCASLADVFDNEVADDWRIDLATLINLTPDLDWLLLTKRIGNAKGMLAKMFPRGILPNVWLGATVVNQDEADRDIPKLLDTPAAKRFLSMEPLLGPVDLNAARLPCQNAIEFPITMDPETGSYECCKRCDFTGLSDEWGIDWVIAGGESGPNARPMHPDWARSLRDQCQAANVPFFFKQFGEWLPINQQEEEFTNRLYKPNRVAKQHEDQCNLDDIYGRRCTVESTVIHMDGSTYGITEPMAFWHSTSAMTTFKVGKKASGRILDGRQWSEFPL